MRSRLHPASFFKLAALVFSAVAAMPAIIAAEPFQAGAAVVDITPPRLPVRIAGGFVEKTGTAIVDRLHVRCFVFADGRTKIAFAIVDTCMMTQSLIDEAKRIAAAQCGLATNRMMVSATHTHSAPAAMGCLGTRLDQDYAAWLPGKIAEGIVAAHARLQPARIGWAAIDDWEHTHNRRWIRRSDKKLADPFGQPTALANMHPGYLSPEIIGPSGPVDPGLWVLAVQALDGRPLAVLANYSQHYFGAAPVSADYYGLFCQHVARRLGQAGDGNGPFVCAMSQGTSGDLMWMDYGSPKKNLTADGYAGAVAAYAVQALAKVQYHSNAPLAMVEQTLPLHYRVPDSKRLEWARPIAAQIVNELAKDRTQVYAQEALILHARQKTELTLQAIRIGDLSIATLPNEVYALTGLKLKAQSPFASHFNIELANGAEGYIPTPEQHALGGYTTWPARTAGLEVQAEPKIVAALLTALEQATGAKRRILADEPGAYSEAILGAKPVAYWRLNDAAGQSAENAVPGGAAAAVSAGAAWYLPGVGSGTGIGAGEKLIPSAFSGPKQINRAIHLAGGDVTAEVRGLGDHYSVALWVWLGEASGASERGGTLISGPGGETLGSRQFPDHRVQFQIGNATTDREMRADDWHFAVLVRDGREVRLHVDGRERPAITHAMPLTSPRGRLVFGQGLQGKLDEIAVFPRVLAPAEIAAFWQASGMVAKADTPPPPRAANARPPELLAPPLPPAESLKKIHVPAGFRVELAAAEPLLLDPVAFDWDERGRLWVVEMADYPQGLDGKGKPGGRVRVLEDTDGDGRYDKSTLFAENLNFPNGILCWRDGALITAAPEILLLRDTDGDGRADRKEVLISGLPEGNQQLRANALRWGLDNWVYIAAGSPNAKRFGAELRLKSTRLDREVFVGGRDYRFRPDTGELEPTSGPTQFGRNRDNWGRWFGTQNSNPLWHYALPEHYLRRNPHFGAAQTVVQLLTPANPPVFPASELERRLHHLNESGHFTSACGGMIYRDRVMFGPEGHHAFICEPVHNLVQHAVLTEQGTTFSAHRVADEARFDFFASEDRWCRPVMIREGPDGALWVADMYRYIIEHPLYLPAEHRDEFITQYRLGDDRGRLYRVSRKAMPAFKPARFDQLGPAELVAALDSTNGWRRDKVHQILLWRADQAAVAPLRALLEHSDNPLARLHALCVLDGLGELQPATVIRALADKHPGVRENALRLAETRLTPDVLAATVRLANDPAPKVRLQLAFTLGASSEAVAGETLGRLLVAEASDPIMVAAAMSSALPHLRTLTAVAARRPQTAVVEPLLAIALGLNDREALVPLLTPIFTAAGENYTAGQLAQFAQLLDQIAQLGGTLEKLQAGSADDALSRLLSRSTEIFTRARRIAADESTPATIRIETAVLISRTPALRSEALSLLVAWLQPQHPVEAQSAAIRALTAIAAEATPAILAKAWPTMSPATQQLALNTWMSREPWAFDLLQRLKRQELPASAFGPTERARLVRHGSKRISQLAGALFAATSSTRGRIVEGYRPALALPGDAAKGHALFAAVCAACHKRGAEGRELGPDLVSVVGHTPERLLGSILDPSADIQPGFSAYTCTLNTGEQIYGLLAAENASGVVMKLVDGSKRSVLRSQIRTLQSQNVSLMPEGLEAAIDLQAMADLITFLRQPIMAQGQPQAP